MRGTRSASVGVAVDFGSGPGVTASSLRWLSLMMKATRKITGRPMQFGGEEHSGWLPANASPPLPTPVRHALVDLCIVDDGHGFLLICESRNTDDSWDTWHETIEDAQAQAEAWLGIKPEEWEAP
jgi:hypothetical protein